MHIKPTTKVAPVSFFDTSGKINCLEDGRPYFFAKRRKKNAQQAKSTAENQIKMAKTHCSSSSSSSEIILVWAQFGPLYLSAPNSCWNSKCSSSRLWQKKCNEKRKSWRLLMTPTLHVVVSLQIRSLQTEWQSFFLCLGSICLGFGGYHSHRNCRNWGFFWYGAAEMWERRHIL